MPIKPSGALASQRPDRETANPVQNPESDSDTIQVKPRTTAPTSKAMQPSVKKKDALAGEQVAVKRHEAQERSKRSQGVSNNKVPLAGREGMRKYQDPRICWPTSESKDIADAPIVANGSRKKRKLSPTKPTLPDANPNGLSATNTSVGPREQKTDSVQPTPVSTPSLWLTKDMLRSSLRQSLHSSRSLPKGDKQRGSSQAAPIELTDSDTEGPIVDGSQGPALRRIEDKVEKHDARLNDLDGHIAKLVKQHIEKHVNSELETLRKSVHETMQKTVSSQKQTDTSIAHTNGNIDSICTGMAEHIEDVTKACNSRLQAQMSRFVREYQRLKDAQLALFINEYQRVENAEAYEARLDEQMLKYTTQTKRDHATLKTSVHANNKDVIKVKDDVEKVKKETQDVKRGVKNALKEKVQLLKMELDRVHEDTSRLEGELTDVKEELTGVKKELAEAKLQSSAANEKAEAAHVRLTAVEQQLDKLQLDSKPASEYKDEKEGVDRRLLALEKAMKSAPEYGKQIQQVWRKLLALEASMQTDLFEPRVDKIVRKHVGDFATYGERLDKCESSVSEFQDSKANAVQFNEFKDDVSKMIEGQDGRLDVFNDARFKLELKVDDTFEDMKADGEQIKKDVQKCDKRLSKETGKLSSIIDTRITALEVRLDQHDARKIEIMPAQHHAVTNSAPSERTNISGMLESPINLTDGPMNRSRRMPPPPLPVHTAQTTPPIDHRPIDNDTSRQHQGMPHDPSSFTASHPQAQTRTFPGRSMSAAPSSPLLGPNLPPSVHAGRCGYCLSNSGILRMSNLRDNVPNDLLCSGCYQKWLTNLSEDQPSGNSSLTVQEQRRTMQGQHTSYSPQMTAPYPGLPPAPGPDPLLQHGSNTNAINGVPQGLVLQSSSPMQQHVSNQPYAIGQVHSAPPHPQGMMIAPTMERQGHPQAASRPRPSNTRNRSSLA